MTSAEVTFYAVAIGVSVAGTALVYPGVRKHAQTAKNSLLAAFMASLLFGTAVALVASVLVNATVTTFGGP